MHIVSLRGFHHSSTVTVQNTKHTENIIQEVIRPKNLSNGPFGMGRYCPERTPE